MRTAWIVTLVVVLGGVASAQDAEDVPLAPPGTAPVGPPQGPAMVPPPYAYQPAQPVVLSAEDQELLARGEMPDGPRLGGGVAAFFLGFGIGQAIQGRWTETGWIFTLGEGASFTAMIYGLSEMLQDCPIGEPSSSCSSNRGTGYLVGGVLAFAGLHVWEVLDAFIVPARRNERVRMLRARLGLPQQYTVRPYVGPARGGPGSVAGLTISF